MQAVLTSTPVRTEMEKEIEALLADYDKTPEDLIMVLQDIQGKYNWLPREALEYVSRRLDVPLAQIYHIGTFYKAFSLEPRGKHILHLCMGTACHVRGAMRIAEEYERQFGLKLGKTSKDGMITFERVNCLGACAIGPIIVVDGEYKGDMTVNRANAIIKRLRREDAGEAGDD